MKQGKGKEGIALKLVLTSNTLLLKDLLILVLLANLFSVLFGLGPLSLQSFITMQSFITKSWLESRQIFGKLFINIYLFRQWQPPCHN